MNSLAGRDEGRKPLSLVQQGTDTILHIDLVSTLSGDAFDPAQLTQLSATIQNDSRTASALIPVTIQDGALSIELTADLSRRLGTGYYTLTITGRTADSAYADGFRDYTIPLSLCRVTRSPAPSVPDKLTATVRDGLRGEKGEKGADGRDGERGQDGVPGKSAYDIALEEGFTGSKQDWLNSLKGEKGERGEQGEVGVSIPITPPYLMPDAIRRTIKEEVEDRVDLVKDEMDAEYKLWSTKAWTETNKRSIERIFEFLRSKFPEDRDKFLEELANETRVVTPRERRRY